MVGAVVHGDVEVHDLVAAQRAVLGGLADTGIDRRDELLGDGAANGVVAEGVALPGSTGEISIQQWPYWPLPPV